MPGAGKIIVETKQDLARGVAKLIVTDTGCGMNETEIKECLQPFNSSWEDAKGYGLGLPMAQRIIKHHNGELIIQSIKGEGTSMIVELPYTRKETVIKTSGLILIIGEGLDTVGGISSFLQEQGFQVKSFSDADAGCEWFEKHSDQIALTLVNSTFKTQAGKACFSALLEICPRATVAVCSSKGCLEAEKALEQGALRNIERPMNAKKTFEWLFEVLN
jgi:hypothetical protein